MTPRNRDRILFIFTFLLWSGGGLLLTEREIVERKNDNIDSRGYDY
jgi:hypothetical protein